jgi:hypothetical protein
VGPKLGTTFGRNRYREGRFGCLDVSTFTPTIVEPNSRDGSNMEKKDHNERTGNSNSGNFTEIFGHRSGGSALLAFFGRPCRSMQDSETGLGAFPFGLNGS